MNYKNTAPAPVIPPPVITTDIGPLAPPPPYPPQAPTVKYPPQTDTTIPPPFHSFPPPHDSQFYPPYHQPPVLGPNNVPQDVALHVPATRPPPGMMASQPPHGPNMVCIHS